MTSLTIEDIKCLDQGIVATYVMRLDFTTGGGETGYPEAFVFPIMKRKDGLLCAVPMDFIPDEALDGGSFSAMEDLIGPSRKVSVPAVMEEMDGTELALDFEIECLLVDFHANIVGFIRDFDPVTEGDGILPYYRDNPDVLPEANSLLAAAHHWVGEGGERVKFYSAAEEEAVVVNPRSLPAKQKKPKAPAAPKRVTTAALAEQLAAISEALPNITGQLTELAQRQDRLDLSMAGAASGGGPRLPPHQQLFAPPTTKPDAEAQARFLRAIGTPPRLRPSPEKRASKEAAPAALPEDEPVLLPSDPDYNNASKAAGGPRPQVTEILAQQSLALTSLVAHLASQDGYPDLATSTSSSLSMRGTLKREKLMNDLAARRGDFFLKVSQNAFRRLRPTEAVPTALDSFPKKGIFTKYLERQGGYVGHRDQGLIMWLLAFVADQMMAEDYVGAREHLALAMVSIEQAAQDGVKWDVAWLLSLQEDPPPSLFASRPASTNPRLRAFAPLCPQEWATVALGYVKEVDLISSRRQESLHPKSPGSQQMPTKKPEDKDAWKKKPRFPKRPKQGAEETTS